MLALASTTNCPSITQLKQIAGKIRWHTICQHIISHNNKIKLRKNNTKDLTRTARKLLTRKLFPPTRTWGAGEFLQIPCHHRPHPHPAPDPRSHREGPAHHSRPSHRRPFHPRSLLRTPPHPPPRPWGS